VGGEFSAVESQSLVEVDAGAEGEDAGARPRVRSGAGSCGRAALTARAGHSDFKATQGYIDLAGETFRSEAERLEERLLGPQQPPKSEESSGTRSGKKNGDLSPAEGTESAV